MARDEMGREGMGRDVMGIGGGGGGWGNHLQQFYLGGAKFNSLSHINLNRELVSLKPEQLPKKNNSYWYETLYWYHVSNCWGFEDNMMPSLPEA